MKKILALAFLVSIFACDTETKDTTTIFNLTLTNSVAEEAVIRGNDFEHTIAIPAGQTQLTDTLNIPRDGFYELYINRERTLFYLEQDTEVNVAIDANQFNESIFYAGDLAAENNYLVKKYLLNEGNNIRDLYGKDVAGFENELNTQKAQLDSLAASLNITNKAFTEVEKRDNGYTRALMYNNYQEYHRYFGNDPEFTVPKSFLAEVEKINMADTVAFRNSVAYQQLVSSYYSRLVNEEAQKQEDYNMTLGYLKKVDASLPDGYAKSKMMSEYLQYGLRPDESLEEVYDIYKNVHTDKEAFDNITERYTLFKTIAKGQPSPTFDYENYKGGTTKLEDLNGKYVYIDIWATWCGPCIAEIPALKELEEEMKDEAIEFVSISIDTPQDYEKWKDMIAQRELGGTQLMSNNNWKSEFVTDYGILGIPRFILVDPDGNIVTADAPRPSNPKLKQMLEEMI